MKGKKQKTPPRDINQLAKYIVELSTGTLDNEENTIPKDIDSKKKATNNSGKTS